MAKATAQIEITASSSRLVQGLASASAKFQTFAGGVARGMSRAFKGINARLEPGQTASRALGNFGGDMIGRGMDAAIDAASEVREFERGLVRQAIAAGEATSATRKLRGVVNDASRDTGVARGEILAGAQAYVGFTGDAKGAAAAAKLFADVQAATGTAAADSAQALSALKTSLGITADEGEAAFSALIVQGKGGAVEIKDMAGELAALAPQFAQFRGGKGLGGLRELGAGFQVIMKNAATASDAATKFRALMSALADPRTLKGLKGIGIEVFDDKGKIKDASTIFDLLAKSKKLGDTRTLAKIFGREEARSAVLALREHIGTYHELRAAAEDTGAVQRDKMQFLESDAGRLDKAVNGLKLTIAEAFTPDRINAFVNAVEDAAEHVDELVEGMGKVFGFLGSLNGVGKSIRGALSDNPTNNPWLATRFVDEATVRTGGRGRFRAGFGGQALPEIGPQRSPTEAAAHVRLAQTRLAASAAYDRAVASITSGEVNDRSSPESIRRAFVASKGAYGEDAAGRRYLEAAGVTPEKAEEAFTKAIVAALERGQAKIAEAIKAGAPTVQIGDNQVARSVDAATDARRRPQ